MTVPRTPHLAVDIIIAMADGTIALIERAHPPSGWALPGGFVDIGETLAQAAVREAREETGLEITLITLLGCYSDPARDARGHTVSVVYIASAYGEPCAADDAKNIVLTDPCHPPAHLAFDHALILADYVRYRDTGVLPRPY
jgi:8-oxo-dGTP diphosphatase